jgi:hypothetical protein
MSQATAGIPLDDNVPGIDLRNLLWVALAALVLIAAIQIDIPWLLNFVHVMSGVLWTGIDLFMGFVIGPVLRKSPIPARRAIIIRLMPKMLFLMPTLSALTITAGYYHAQQIGLLSVGYPEFIWVMAALFIALVLTVEGLGLLLPTNLLVYFEMRKARPDGARIGRLMQRYIWFVSIQGVMQVVMIVIMARFVTGL